MTTVSISGGNLFRLAAQHLNDATRWEEIARLNGMSDPVLLGLQTIKLPSVAKARVNPDAIR